MIRALRLLRYRIGMARLRFRNAYQQGRLRAAARKTGKDVLAGRAGEVVRRLFLTHPLSIDIYEKWMSERVFTPRRLARFVERGKALVVKPRFSVVMPTYNSPVPFLRKAIDSVLRQTY